MSQPRTDDSLVKLADEIETFIERRANKRVYIFAADTAKSWAQRIRALVVHGTTPEHP